MGPTQLAILSAIKLSLHISPSHPYFQVASGLINVKPLITHRFKLEESAQAFETAKTGAGGAIKVMIGCKKV